MLLPWLLKCCSVHWFLTKCLQNKGFYHQHQMLTHKTETINIVNITPGKHQNVNTGILVLTPFKGRDAQREELRKPLTSSFLLKQHYIWWPLYACMHTRTATHLFHLGTFDIWWQKFDFDTTLWPIFTPTSPWLLCVRNKPGSLTFLLNFLS